MVKEEDEKTEGLSPKDKLLDKLKKMEEAGMATTKMWAAMWQQNLQYFFSEQLAHKKVHKDWEWVIVNYIWPSAIQEIGKLSKNYPKILTNPTEDSDTEIAEAWQSILQWLWEKGLNGHGMRIEELYAILDGKLFGYRVSKVYWDDKPRHGWDDENKEWVGEVRHRLWHPAEFWASDKEKIQDGACGTVRYVDLDYAIHKWPKFEKELQDEATKYHERTLGGAEHIRGQIESSGTYPSAGLGGIDKGLGTQGTNRLLNLIYNSSKLNGTDNRSDKKFVKISEAYFYDDDSTKEKIEEDIPREELVAAGQIYVKDGIIFSTDTKKPIPQTKWPRRTVKEWEQPKFPDGRYVTRVGDTILNPKEEDQKYPYKRWPFVVIPHYLLPHMWQGMDAVQIFKSMQDMINVTISHLANNFKQFGDPKVAMEKGAMDTPPGRHKKHYRIGRGAGAIIRLARGGIAKMKIIDPPTLSPSAFALYNLFTQEFKNLFGLQSIAKGEKQPGKMTATESRFLMISSNDRIQLQSVFEDEWIKQVASLTAETTQRNYSVGRMVRIIGEDKIQGAIEISQKIKEARFDIDIEPGQTLPFDEEKRIARYTAAYTMLQEPITNPMLPEMLRILEISGWQKILQKYEAWQVYFQFYQLQEQIRAGKLEPEEAVKMLVQKAMEVYAAAQPQEQEAGGKKPQGEKQNVRPG